MKFEHWLIVLLALLIISPTFVVGVSCRSNPVTGELEPDYPLIRAELQNLEQDATEILQLIPEADVDLKQTFDRIQISLQSLQDVVAKLETGQAEGEPQLLMLLDVLLNSVPEASAVFTSDETTQARIRAGVVVLRSGLRHTKTLLGAVS